MHKEPSANLGTHSFPSPHPHRITVIVFAPRSTEPKRFEWPVAKLVGDAADEAAKAFGYEAGTPSFQNDEDEVLDRRISLERAGVEHKDKLELVDTGGGV